MSKQLALALHTFSLVAQILFLWSPPFHGRRSFAVLTIVSLAVAVHFAGPTSDIPGDAQPFALLWPIVSRKAWKASITFLDITIFYSTDSASAVD